MTSQLLVPPLVGHLRVCETEAVTDPQLATAHAAYRRAEKALDAKRDELFKAIGEAVTTGRVRQSDVVKQMGYTREHVRRICRAYEDWRDGKTTELKIAR
jgi:hypothetical protein